MEFSPISKTRLATCRPELQDVFNTVNQFFACEITCGHRNEYEQNKAYAEGKSEKKWPNGDHNVLPSNAVDAYPKPVVFSDINRMMYFAGFVVAVGAMKGHRIQWGNDWDMDTELKDENFHDYGHFAYKGRLYQKAADPEVAEVEQDLSERMAGAI